MNRLSVAASALAALFVAAMLVLAILRVGALMDRELDQAGPSTMLAEGSDPVLLEADLLAGDHLTFELCSNDPMAPERWTDAIALTLDAGDTEPRDRILDETMDAPMLEGARRETSGACLDFARAGPLELGGHYVVGARGVGSSMAGVTVRARVVAERPLDSGDRNDVLGILLGAMALVIALALRPPGSGNAVEGGPWSVLRASMLGITIALVAVALVVPDLRLPLSVKLALLALTLPATFGGAYGLARGRSEAGAILGVIVVIELSTILSIITPPGPTFGLMAGLGLAACEVVIALALARTFAGRSGLRHALALERPSNVMIAWGAFVMAPIAGVLLRILATRVLALVPSTGEAPIEAYVQWPSGLLSFAALSAIAPIGEEIFFRGLVYGAIRGEGGRAKESLAFLGAWLLFVLAHLPQTWGSWGGLAAVAVAGLGFTALRALTGSVLVAALAHLVYNGLLAVAALTAS